MEEAVEEKPRFAFVSNIIETKDIRLPGFYPFWGKVIPLFIWDWLFIIKALFGRGFSVVAEYDAFDRVHGYTVLVEMTAKQIVSRSWMWLGRRKVLEACLYAQEELGVKVIGLGSLTKSITDEGYYLKKNGVRVAVTHGDSYSVASALEGVEFLLDRFNVFNPKIGIVGAYGKIGKALTTYYAKTDHKVMAMGRKLELLEEMQKTLPGLEITTSLRQILDTCDLIIMTTSAPYSLINESLLRKDKRYLLYDLGQPNNLFKRDYERLLSAGYDIVRVDGGFEESIKPLEIGFWMRLPHNTFYACYVEALLQAMVGDYEDHIGPVELVHMAETRSRSLVYGFTHRRLSVYGEDLTEFLIDHKRSPY